MNPYESHLEKCLSFIDENKSLVDCHLVDFITENLWEKCLSSKLRCPLELLGNTNLDTAQLSSDKINNELSNFIEQTNILNLKNCPDVLQVEEISTLLPLIKFDWTSVEENNDSHDDFMKDKKRYEISVLTQVIGYLTKANSNLVIDVGAGKGYLATSLSRNYSIPVLAIDSCKSRQNSAIHRQKMMTKTKLQSVSSVKYSVKFIDDTTDYLQLVRSSFPNYTNIEDNFTLVGLHTCGPLAHAMMKSFLNSSCLSILCVISCCYHLTEESLTGKCYMTKNARMLAQQSVERMSMKNKPQSPSLFYRAVLQVLLKSLGMADVRIGRRAPMDNFVVYAKWSLTKIGIEVDKIPSDQQLKQLYDSYMEQQWRIDVFQLLRIHAGSVVEAAIVLERALYLYQSRKCTKVALIKFFDPLLSPRCYGIIALK